MGDLYDQFIDRNDLNIHKWHHYFPIYERYFSKFRGKSPRMLEIGVQKGGSSRLFLDWFGDGAHITGADIDPRCADKAIPDRLDIEIGDQADPAFLQSLVSTYGPWDIILDDGGHTNNQIITSFQALFPQLKDGGVYLIEDTHAHWWGGAFRDHPRGMSVVSLVADLFDNMHRWTGNQSLFDHWHTPPEARSETISGSYLTRHVSGVHLFDSIIVIEKARRAAVQRVEKRRRAARDDLPNRRRRSLANWFSAAVRLSSAMEVSRCAHPRCSKRTGN